MQKLKHIRTVTETKFRQMSGTYKHSLQVPIPLTATLALFPTYTNFVFVGIQRYSTKGPLSLATWSVAPESRVQRGFVSASITVLEQNYS